MPYLKITASKSLDAGQKHKLLNAASKMVATELDKPEQYVMVSVESSVQMQFAGTEELCAFLELRGIELPSSKTGKLSQLLCGLMESQTGIRRDRVYINFADIKPSMWGWNGETF
jgi:phenylpyruvate tautomerase